MKKKLLSFLLCLCMVCTLLPVTAWAAAGEFKVAGVALTESGYYEVKDLSTKLDTAPAAPDAKGYIHWDKDSHTLTLHNAKIDGGYHSDGIYYNGNFTIKLEGVNTVISGPSNAITCDNGSVTIKGSGGSDTLNATGATNGIYAMYTISITGGATVTATGVTECGVINARPGSSYNADPVFIDESATVIISGNTYGIGTGTNYGASPVINSPNVTITGRSGAFQTYRNGAPTLASNIAAQASTNIDGSNPVAYNGSDYTTYKWFKTGAITTHTVTFAANGGTGTMAPATGIADSYVLPANGFTAPDGKQFKAWSVGGDEKNPGDTITVTADTTVTAVWQSVVPYDLWVGGVQVTSANAGGVTGSGITGTVTYDHATKTLTLNNATVTDAYDAGSDVVGIYALSNIGTLNINLVGNNTVTGQTDAEGHASYGMRIKGGGVNFTGNGSLTISAANTVAAMNSWSVAILTDNGDIVVGENCTIVAFCGNIDGGYSGRTSAIIPYGSNTKLVVSAQSVAVGNKTTPTADALEAFSSNKIRDYKYVKIAPGGTVTLNVDGGTVNNGNVTYYFKADGAVLPTDVTKTSQAFEGWYENSECTGTAVTVIPAGSTGDKTYYAKWTTNEYSVTLNAQGGTIAAGKDVAGYTYGVGVTLPAASDVTKTGYTFGGWYENAECTGTAVTAIGATATGDKTYYAKWTANEYTVTLNAQGGTIAAGKDVTGYTYGVGVALPVAADMTKTGYTFGGWYENAECTGTAVTAIGATATGDKTYYAKWTANEYTVTLNAQGGTIAAGKDVTGYTYGIGTTLPVAADMTKAGYTFGGWYENAECTGTAVTAISATDTGDKTYYAKWTANEYTVTLNAQGGTIATGKDVTGYTYGVGAALPVAADMTKTGYTFGGWYENSECTGTAVTAISTTDTGDKTYYAKWTANEYNVILNALGGTIAAGKDVTTYIYGVGANLPAASDMSKDGYTFVGWYTTANPTDGDAAVTVIGASETGSKVFYAKWTANNGNAGDGNNGNVAPATPSAPATSPMTGDTMNVPVMFALMVGSLSAACAIIFYVSKKKHADDN